MAFDSNSTIQQSSLTERVLILNRCFVPIHITSIKRAVTLLFLDIAQGVDSEYQTYEWADLWQGNLPEEKRQHFHFLKSIRTEVPVPKVIILKDFDKRPPQTVKFSRVQVFLRDRHTCQYCSKVLPRQRLNLDHVVPRTQGGKTTWENVVASCHHCNWKKGGRTPAQAGMKLLTQPRRPKFSPNLQTLTSHHPIWNQFLFSDQTG